MSAVLTKPIAVGTQVIIQFGDPDDDSYQAAVPCVVLQWNDNEGNSYLVQGTQDQTLYGRAYHLPSNGKLAVTNSRILSPTWPLAKIIRSLCC
jgi:hypothetical protein